MEKPNQDPAITSNTDNLSTQPDTSSRAAKPNSSITRLILGIIVIAVIAIGIGLLTHRKSTTPLNNSSSPPAYVSITNSGFDPATITINNNQPVVWTNNDSKAHQVASDPYPQDNALAGFKDGTSINNGQTYSFVFNKAGTYTYHDNLNPSTFKGTVVVK